jgi:hypothetical protein
MTPFCTLANLLQIDNCKLQIEQNIIPQTVNPPPITGPFTALAAKR